MAEITFAFLIIEFNFLFAYLVSSIFPTFSHNFQSHFFGVFSFNLLSTKNFCSCHSNVFFTFRWDYNIC